MSLHRLSRAAITTAALSITLAAAALTPALAQNWPQRPIRIIVGFPPGGAVDLTARLLQPKLSAGFGQPVIIENRAGFGGIVGADAVSHAPPDGYVLGYIVGSDLAMRPAISTQKTVSPLTDLTPIASVVESVGCIAVASNGPINSIADLIATAKKNPGKLTFGSPGVNSAPHLTGEFLRQQGLDMVHVPFNGLAPGVVALVSGQIDVAISNIATVSPQVKDGKVRILAVTRPARYEDAPNVPTVAEAIPGFSVPVAFYGLFGPPGLPQPIVQRIAAETSKALESPEIVAKTKELYMSRIYNPPEAFTAMIRNAVDSYAKIVKAAGIKPE